MGHFSFTKADGLTKTANVVMNAPYKLLVPSEFRGVEGAIQDSYSGFGKLGQNDAGDPLYDIHELLAFWNADLPLTKRCAQLAGLHGKVDTLAVGPPVKYALRYMGAFPKMKTVDGDTDWNRNIGIALFHEAEEGAIHLIYPLKLVSASYGGTYEECQGMSISDPNQGICELKRSEIGSYPYDKGSTFYERFQTAMNLRPR